MPSIAIVTGGAGGIGAPLCRALAADGYSVVVADFAADAGSALAEEINRSGGKAVFQQLAQRLFPALIETLASDLSLDEKIERLVGIYLDNLSRSPFLPGYLLSELHYHPERFEQLLSLAGGAAPSKVMSPILDKLRRQIDEGVRAGTMRPITPEQFAVNIISLCIFPFAARPMIAAVFSMDDAALMSVMDRPR